MVASALSLKIGQRQIQSPALTPALQQALKLLQLSGLELDALVREALETNPLLVADAASTDLAPTIPSPVQRRSGAGYRLSPQAICLFGSAAQVTRQTPGGADMMAGGHADPDRLGVQDGGSLQDALLEDIAFTFDDPVERQIAMDLSGLLDDSGYLAGDLEDVAEYRKVPAAHVEHVLARLQEAAPAGLFARDLKECLRLQLKDRGTLDEVMIRILDHLEILAEHDPVALAAAVGLDVDEVSLGLDKLRQLDPRPGTAFAGQTAPVIVPDIIVLPIGTHSSHNSEHVQAVGRWTVGLNLDLVPKLSLDCTGLDILRARARREEERAYLKASSRDATWLIRAIEQRTATLLRIGVEIFRRQEGFLEGGPLALKPLTQKEIARVTEVHESTISRAVNRKFAATPQGLVPLKFLFSNSVRDLNGGRDHASKVVRQRLKALISAEAAPTPDEALTRQLRSEGYDVARRTVAKYRGMLRIPSSVVRKCPRTAGLAKGTGS